MIHKKHFGKRIADFRRSLGLSQMELAQSMGVSAQAVSKWETGAALPDIELLLELSKMFGVSVNELLEDNSLVKCLAIRAFTVKNGVACFVPDSPWPEWERQMREENWVLRNWQDAWGQPGGWADTEQGKNPQVDRWRESRRRVGRRIAERGGRILEIGAGPGGGYMPYILQAEPSAQIIVSDLSRVVVEEWKNLLETELDSPHLCFAAMDFCDIPFADCSIDVVSDHGGIINCIGDREKALREIYRVLKPGGMIVSLNGFVTKKTLAELSDSAQQALLREWPEVFDDLYGDTVQAGFRKIDSVVEGVWNTDEDESGIADFARELGIKLEFTQYVRFCEK